MFLSNVLLICLDSNRTIPNNLLFVYHLDKILSTQKMTCLKKMNLSYLNRSMSHFPKKITVGLPRYIDEYFVRSLLFWKIVFEIPRMASWYIIQSILKLSRQNVTSTGTFNLLLVIEKIIVKVIYCLI